MYAKALNRKLRLLTAMMAILTACANDFNTQEMYFIGDSLVARWDLQQSFPFWVTHNDGVSGAGIEYIESRNGAYKDKSVVVLIGTNDISGLKEEELDDYCERHVNAIVGLQADRTYLISIPPRQFTYDRNGLNDFIKKANSAIKERIKSMSDVRYIDVYDAMSRHGTINMEYSYDGLHLNIYGYEVVTKIIMNNP